MLRPANRLALVGCVALALLAPWPARAADPDSLSMRLILARKAEKPDLPASLADVAKDLRSLGYNSATLLSTAKLDVKKENTHKMTVEKDFTVSVSVKPPEGGKVPVQVEWLKGKSGPKFKARVREPVISGGGPHKDGTVFLILKAP